MSIYDYTVKARKGHGSNIADDTILRQYRQYLIESIEGIFHRSGIDDQFGTEFFDFFQFREAVAIVHET